MLTQLNAPEFYPVFDNIDLCKTPFICCSITVYLLESHTNQIIKTIEYENHPFANRFF